MRVLCVSQSRPSRQPAAPEVIITPNRTHARPAAKLHQLWTVLRGTRPLGGHTARPVLLACLIMLSVLLLLCCFSFVQDVPAVLNSLMDSLPSRVSIQGLPFDAVFTYAVYTLNYVIVKVCGAGAGGSDTADTSAYTHREGERETPGLTHGQSGAQCSCFLPYVQHQNRGQYTGTASKRCIAVGITAIGRWGSCCRHIPGLTAADCCTCVDCWMQGYGEVAVPPEPSPSVAGAAAAHTPTDSAHAATDPTSAAAADAAALATPAAAAPGSDAAAIQAAVALAGQAPGAAGSNSSSSSSAEAAAASLSALSPGLAAARRLLQISQGSCPFPAGPLPLTPAEIGGDSSMFSAYLHEAIPNCILWGLFKSGALRTTVKDGNIPQLRLITDLFGGLIPELPKHYSKKGMLLEIDMIAAPEVSQHTAAPCSLNTLRFPVPLLLQQQQQHCYVLSSSGGP